MVEVCRAASGNLSSGRRVPFRGGTRSGRGIKRPHSGAVKDLTEEGASGANGWREQMGPVQGQGLLGWRGSDFGTAGVLTGTGSTGVRSMWVGESQPAQTGAGARRTTARHAEGKTPERRTRLWIDPRIS